MRGPVRSDRREVDQAGDERLVHGQRETAVERLRLEGPGDQPKDGSDARHRR
ncbi:hypothetical protein [Streptomyces sp. ISL-10]|uniref:hypothetical protein n=1 Tax=Streptomyces sp. ISL-10 TaxID=2819172 RepID=UPI0035AB99FA